MGKPKIKFHHTPVRTYGTTHQVAWVGAQATVSQRGVLPTFTALDTKYVNKTTGSNSNAGTVAAPYADPDYARSQLGGAFVNVVITDSATYPTAKIDWNKPGTSLYAADGKTPVIQFDRGAGITGPYGSRTGHISSAAVVPSALFSYVNNTTGNDGTGVFGDATKPFKTIQAGVVAARILSGVRWVLITNSGGYFEDIDGGAFPLNIIAATGMTPTLTNVATGAGNYHIQNSGGYAMKLYGLNIREKITSAGTAVYNPSGALTLYDCTISSGQQATTSASITATNCYIYNSLNGFDFTTTATVTNCQFGQLRGVSGNAIYGHNTAILNVTWCSFIGWAPGIQLSRCIYKTYGSATASDDTISNCAFDNFYTGIEIGAGGGATVGTTKPVISNCSFNQGTNPMIFTQCAGTPNVSEVLCSYNAGPDLQAFADQDSVAWTFTVRSMASIGNLATTGCIKAQLQNSFGTIVARNFVLTATNCTFVNAAGGAFYVDADKPAVMAYGSVLSVILNSCVEKNCLAVGVVKGVVRNNPTLGVLTALIGGQVKNTNYENVGISDKAGDPGSFISYSSSNLGDPKILSSVPGRENLGLQPDSSAFMTGVTQNGDDRGINAYAFKISASSVTINGIIFRSAGSTDADLAGLNMRGAVQVDPNLSNIHINYCSFNRFGLFGVKAYSSTQVLNCEFRDATSGESAVGNGIVVVGNGCAIQSCTFISCTGAGICNFQADTKVTFNSSYACMYGQYDGQIVLGSYSNNIYSQSGAYDYSGRGTQDHSCIGTIPSFALLTSSLRSDPLFRDPNGGDLRLQTLEYGYPNNSPCRRAATPASMDMGAFNFFYDVLTTNWTTVNFSTSGWLNPSRVVRRREFMHLAEDAREDDSTFSAFTGTRRAYDYIWNDQQAMPPAQVTAIETMLESTGDVQVDMGLGDGWQDCMFLRAAAPLEYEEIGGLYVGYTANPLPTPIKQFSVRLQSV